MEIVLLWCFVLAWMTKRGAEDLVHAVKGTPNPRYELKKAKARAAGQQPKQQPRYGGKEWFADLMSDAMIAHTEKRRTKTAAKAQPVDDMIGILRESKAQPKAERVYDPNNTRDCPECKGEVVLDGRPCPRCLAKQQERNAEREAQGGLGRTFGSPEEREQKIRKLQDVALAKLAESGSRTHRDSRGRCTACGEPNPFDTPCSSHNPAALGEEKPVQQDDEDDRLTGDDVIAGLAGPGGLFPYTQCPRCSKFIQVDAAGKPQCGCLRTNTPDTRPDAQIIQFPNIKHIEKEIDMSNPEATGLPTAIAFADAAAQAHATFSTAGSEGYAGALERMGFGDGITALAGAAREQSTIAAEKWTALSAAMNDFMQGREFYANNPDAPEKVALVNE